MVILKWYIEIFYSSNQFGKEFKTFLSTVVQCFCISKLLLSKKKKEKKKRVGNGTKFILIKLFPNWYACLFKSKYKMPHACLYYAIHVHEAHIILLSCFSFLFSFPFGL